MKKLLLTSLCFSLAALQASVPQYSQAYPQGYPPNWSASTGFQAPTSPMSSQSSQGYPQGYPPTYSQGSTSGSQPTSPMSSQSSQGYPEGYPPTYSQGSTSGSQPTSPMSSQSSQGYPQGYPPSWSASTGFQAPTSPMSSQSSQGYPQGYPPTYSEGATSGSQPTSPMSSQSSQGYPQGYPPTYSPTQASTASQTAVTALDPRYPQGFTLPQTTTSSGAQSSQSLTETTALDPRYPQGLTFVAPQRPSTQAPSPETSSVKTPSTQTPSAPVQTTASEVIPSNEYGMTWKTPQTYGTRDRQGRPFNVGFEFGNRAKTPVWIQVLNAGKSSDIFSMPAVNPQAGALFRRNFSIDITKPTYLKLWTRDPNEQRNRGRYSLYSFTPRKTAYVVYDPASRPALRPTAGSRRGVFQKWGNTESNLSMRNNVDQKDIQLKNTRESQQILRGEGYRSE